jgi:hypothetical protein
VSLECGAPPLEASEGADDPTIAWRCGRRCAGAAAPHALVVRAPERDHVHLLGPPCPANKGPSLKDNAMANGSADSTARGSKTGFGHSRLR